MSSKLDIAEPDVLLTALDEWHIKKGGRMVPFAGYSMPLQYTGIIEEHLHVRQNVGLFDVSHMGILEVSGPNVVEELELLVPSDLAEQKIGTVKYSFLMNYQGGIEDDLLISRISETSFILVLNAARKHSDIDYLKAHMSGDNILKPRDDLGIIALQGPKAAQVMQELCPEAGKLGFMKAAEFQLNGTLATISRTGYTGEDGFEIIYPKSELEWLVESICKYESVKPIGLGARDSLRLEAGLCLYGHDITTDTSPVEANLKWVLGKRRREQGKFLGEDRVITELESLPKKCRVGIVLEGRTIAREGTKIFSASGKNVGYVTSGGFSPTLKQTIAMGYVDYNFIEIGTELLLEVRNSKKLGKIVRLPFVQQKYYKGKK